MSIKLIASDLDGTFLRDDKSISERNETAVKDVIEQGIYFVPATGRSFYSVPAEIRNFPGIKYVITGNGTAIYSTASEKPIYECRMDPRSIDAILSLPMPESVIIEMFSHGRPYCESRYLEDPAKYGATPFGVKYVRSTRTPLDDIRTYMKEHREEIDECSFMCKVKSDRDELSRRLRLFVPDIFLTTSMTNLVEVGHVKAGKGQTLTWLLNRLNISPEDAMAFGDADNDIEMLQAVKYGIAMENGTSNCLDAARCITASNEEDGVAQAIKVYCGQNQL